MVYERCEEGGATSGDSDTEKRITFIKAKDPISGRLEYRFLGVFEPSGKTGLEDGEEHRVFQRVRDSFPILRS